MNTQVATQNIATVDNLQFTNVEFTAQPNGWRKYGPISVLDNGGSLISTGAFSKMDVYIEPSKVHWTTKENCFVMAPGPDPQWSPKSDFTYPNAGRFTIVATQCVDGLPQKGSNAKMEYTVIKPDSTSSANLQTIDLNGQKNIFFAFNDLAGAYADNSGEFYVYVRLYGEEETTTVDDIKFTQPSSSTAANGWTKFSSLEIINNGGALISKEAYSFMELYIEPSDVHFLPGVTGKVTIPGPTPDFGKNVNFTFPNANMYNPVVFQCKNGVPQQGGNAEVSYTNVEGSATSATNCQTIQLNGSDNVFVAFNDLKGAYGDNSGTFDLYVKLH